MRNLILAAFAARALITAMVSVAFAGLRDTLGNSSTSGGLMGGGG